MKTIIKCIAIMLLLSDSSCAQNDEKNYELDMSNVKKKVSIMVYNAVENENNISKGEIMDHNDSGFVSYSNIYYDEYGNILYEEYYHKGESKPYKTTKYDWYDSSKNKLKTEYYKASENRLGKKTKDYSKTIYERDSNGNLLRKFSVEKYGSLDLNSYKYDGNGNRIEEIEYNGWNRDNPIEEKHIFSNFNNQGNYQKKLTYNSDNQLVEELIIEYYPDGKLVKTEYRKKYKYNQLILDTKVDYIYDNKKNMIQKTETGISTSMNYIEFPRGLSEEEREKYIKEKYYGNNLKLTPITDIFNFTYDNCNRRIYSCSLHESYYEDNRVGKWRSTTNNCWRDASYKDNEKGDWIEMIDYFLNNKPYCIVVRDIKYF